jgi:hypothetical protein
MDAWTLRLATISCTALTAVAFLLWVPYDYTPNGFDVDYGWIWALPPAWCPD